MCVRCTVPCWVFLTRRICWPGSQSNSLPYTFAVHRSHENPAVQKAYEEFLGEPNSHKAHDLLVSVVLICSVPLMTWGGEPGGGETGGGDASIGVDTVVGFGRARSALPCGGPSLTAAVTRLSCAPLHLPSTWSEPRRVGELATSKE
jgi:hypothetical protein